jgi:hypothetical protein
VIEQGREYRAIPYALQRVRGRGLQQSPRLCVTQCGRAAFVTVRSRALDAVRRIDGDCIALTEIVEERRQRGEFAPDAGGCQLARL